MAFRPKTLVTTARIDKIIFHIPEDFKYPAIRRFDECTLTGINVYKLKADTCRL